MWDETLIESKGSGKRAKTWFTFPIALLLHALVIGVLIGPSYWTVEAVQTPPLTKTVVFIGEKPHGGGPAGPIARPKPPGRPATPRTALAQPTTIPKDIVDTPQVSPEVQVAGESSTNSVDSIGSSGSSGPCEYPCIPGDGSGTGSGQGSGSDEPMVITPEVTQPVLLLKITPEYPAIAIRAHIQGIVLLEAVITRTGTVEELRVLHSSHPLLEQAAVKAVRQWLYRPALVNGRPVKVYFNVTIEFKIQ